MINTTNSKTSPTHEEIAACAYQIWEAEGRQEGRDVEYWFQALARLNPPRSTRPAPIARREPAAITVTAKAAAATAKRRKMETSSVTRRQPAFA